MVLSAEVLTPVTTASLSQSLVGLTDQDEAAVKSVPNADERSYGDRPGQWMSYAKPEASALLCQASVWGREVVLEHGFRGLQLPGSSWCLFCNQLLHTILYVTAGSDCTGVRADHAQNIKKQVH